MNLSLSGQCVNLYYFINFSSTGHPSSNCHQCPYGKCIGDNTQLNNIYPGIFNNYTDFLECASYDRIYGLGTYKVLAEGLPECSHPRFKRQITVPLEAEEFGCCGT